MKNKFKISIIMPNYNSYDNIGQTIKSISNQSFKDWELIIVDDNSNAKTIELLKNIKKRYKKKIRIYFLKRNKGDGYCRVFGCKKSKSKLIAFIDSDDIWAKHKLRLQFNFMKKNNFHFTYTNYTPFKDKNTYFKEIHPPKQLSFTSFIKNSSIATSSMMVSKKLLRDIKLSKSPNFEDFFLKCQLLKKVKYANCVNKNLLKYRLRKNSLSKNKFRNIFWLWKINRKFNNLNFFTSLISLICISYNSLKKYGIK